MNDVSIEIARLLKEKGFNERCESWAYLNKNCMAMQYDEKTCVKIPTIFETISWLLKKYNIWIYVRKEWINGECVGFEFIIDDNEGFTYNGSFNSPQDAYLAAIEFTLKMLLPLYLKFDI